VTLVSVTCLYAAMRLRWFGLGDLPWYAPPLMVPALLLTGIFAALRYWFIRKEQFQIVSRTYVGQHGARALSQVLFGLLGSTSAGLLAGEILGRVVGMTALYRKAWPSIREQIARLSMRKIVATLKHHRKLAVYSMPSSLIDTLAANITVPLLVQLYGTHMGGEFALVQRVLAVPLALISSSVAEAFHSRLAVCVRQDNGELKPLFWRTSAALLLIGAAPTAVLLLFGPTLFALVFGQGWHLAGVLAAIYAPWFLAQFVVSPLSRLVFVLRGQEEKLIYDVLLLLSIFLVYAVALHQHLTVIQTVWALMLVNTFAYVVYYCVLVWVLMTHPLSRDVMD
jgi:O-antigen/teichoic acid export membrane protein